MEKMTKSITIDKELNKRISRLSSIMKQSESSFIEQACEYFLKNSKIAEKALKQARGDTKYSEKFLEARETLAEAFEGTSTKNYSGQKIISETSQGKTKTNF